MTDMNLTMKTYNDINEVADILRAKGHDVVSGEKVKGLPNSVYVYCGMGSYLRFTLDDEGHVYLHRPIWNPDGVGIDSTISPVGHLLYDVEAQVGEA